MKLDKLIFREVKKKDFNQIFKIFKEVFKKKISKNFYEWRYNSHHSSHTSFIAIFQKKIVAHIGFVKYRLSNYQNYIYSRHSTFVSNKFQKKGVYSELLKFSFIKLRKKTNFIVAWPNLKNLKASKNHYNFKIINHYHLYYKLHNFIKLNNSHIFKKINPSYSKNLTFDQGNHLFFHDSKYFKWRYLSYKTGSYFYINEHKFINFIFQKKKYKNKIYYLIIDYFGKRSTYIRDLKKLVEFLIVNKINFQLLISSKEKKISNFLDKKKIIKSKNKFNVGLYTLKRNDNYKNLIQKKINYDIKISDTDVFIETF